MSVLSWFYINVQNIVCIISFINKTSLLIRIITFQQINVNVRFHFMTKLYLYNSKLWYFNDFSCNVRFFNFNFYIFFFFFYENDLSWSNFKKDYCLVFINISLGVLHFYLNWMTTIIFDKISMIFEKEGYLALLMIVSHYLIAIFEFRIIAWCPFNWSKFIWRYLNLIQILICIFNIRYLNFIYLMFVNLISWNCIVNLKMISTL